jgi:hypothetical protein
MMTIQSQVDTVILSFGAWRLYGKPNHGCNVWGASPVWGARRRAAAEPDPVLETGLPGSSTERSNSATRIA